MVFRQGFEKQLGGEGRERGHFTKLRKTTLLTSSSSPLRRR